MTYKTDLDEHDAEDCKKRQEEEYRHTLSKEIKDYMRNGDQIILKRVLFKMFVNYPTPSHMRQPKANTIMMLMLNDSSFSSTVTIEQ